ncbi:MAG: hypothetical protein JSS01_02055 [Proteobacteria bacterium]|nr:hypothetical protein [Pseudomonadota bacterium]
MKAMKTPCALWVVAGLLTACGGGGDDNVAAKLEGAYEGGTAQRFVYSVTLENGDSWMLYGIPIGKALDVKGMVRATQGNSDGSSYSAQLRDYSYDGRVSDGSLSGSYVPGQSFRGTTTSFGLTNSFTTEVVKKSDYDYQAPASLSSIAGTWNGMVLGGGLGQITIDATGALRAGFQGCNITGQAQPRASGRNVFDVSLNFGPAPCRLPGEQARGIALSFVEPSVGTQLVITGTTPDGSAGTALLALR